MSVNHSGKEVGCTPSLRSSVPTCDAANNVADILAAAADLIEPEGRWTQGAFARTEKGLVIGSTEKPAICFCAVGAVYRTGRPYGEYKTSRAIDLLAEAVGRCHIGEWNDAPERTQVQVVSALRAAAEKARTVFEAGSAGYRGSDEPNLPTRET